MAIPGGAKLAKARDFYTHHGWDGLGIARLGWAAQGKELKHGEAVFGAVDLGPANRCVVRSGKARNYFVRRIAVNQLVLDMDLYPRQEIDRDNVKRLRKALDAGVTLPPLVVSDSLTIIDGAHRREAYQEKYGEECLVDVVEKSYESRRDMFLDAVRYNASHGTPLVGRDRKRCAELALRFQYADSDIATVLGVTNSEYVSLKPASSRAAPLTAAVTPKRDQENALIQRAQDGDSAAQAKLIEKYTDLCWQLANKHGGRGEESDDDKFQEAQMALWEAAQKYEAHRGLAFITFAQRTIEGRLMSLVQRSGLIRIKSPHGKNNFDKFSTCSIDASFDDDRTTLASQLADDHGTDVDLRGDVQSAVGELPERLRQVVGLRMEGQSLEEIGASIGVSKERVRQLEERAHNLLRSSLDQVGEDQSDDMPQAIKACTHKIVAALKELQQKLGA